MRDCGPFLMGSVKRGQSTELNALHLCAVGGTPPQPPVVAANRVGRSEGRIDLPNQVPEDGRRTTRLESREGGPPGLLQTPQRKQATGVAEVRGRLLRIESPGPGLQFEGRLAQPTLLIPQR